MGGREAGEQKEKQNYCIFDEPEAGISHTGSSRGQEADEGVSNEI